MKRKFKSYVGVDIANLKRQRLFDRWVEKADDWQLIDELEHGWLHKLPRGELEALVRKHINPDGEKRFRDRLDHIEAAASRAQEHVLTQMARLAEFNRVINFLKSANREYIAKLNWHYGCTIKIRSIAMRDSWTPTDFKSNFTLRLSRCACSDDQPQKVHPSVKGFDMGPAPIQFQAEVVHEAWGGGLGTIDKGTMLTFNFVDNVYSCHIQGKGVVNFWNDYEVNALEPEIWMNETLGFCPPIWKLVMDYAKTDV